MQAGKVSTLAFNVRDGIAVFVFHVGHLELAAELGIELNVHNIAI